MENGKLKIEEQRSHLVILLISLLLVLVLFVLGIINVLYQRAKRAREDAQQSKMSFVKEMEMKLLENKISLQQMQDEAIRNSEMWHEEKESLQEDYYRQREEMAEEIIKNNEVIQKIKVFSEKSFKEQFFCVDPLSDDEFAALVTTIDLCYNHFITRLEGDYPRLTQADIYLCCLIKLGIPDQNILYLLDVGKVALRKRKSRLKCEKLDLQEGDSLENYLHLY